MSESAPAPAAKSAPAAKAATVAIPATRNKFARSSLVAATGGALVAAIVGLVLLKADIWTGAGNPDQPMLSFVPHSDLSDAAATLTQSVAGALIDDAKRCNIPLVNLTISKGTAAVGSTIRVRSGSYVSPYFTVTEAVQRVAVPYPAPYGSGAGTFVFEGNANGAIVGLTPTKLLVELPGAQSVPVVWRPRSPC